MSARDRFPSDPVLRYRQHGFAVLRLFDEQQVRVLERFAREWVCQLFAPWTAGKEPLFPLEEYHRWSGALGIPHDELLRAANRHRCPGPEVERVLINERLKGFLRDIGFEQYEIWNEGLGWLGFRLIRPGAGDGYPFTRKAWGIAKRVVSCWVPIVGYNPSETLTLVPGSHLKEYEAYLPVQSKFAKEYRLARVPEDFEPYNPSLRRGEAIIFHPLTLHSEEMLRGQVTRLSLEFRLNPVGQPAVSRGSVAAGARVA